MEDKNKNIDIQNKELQTFGFITKQLRQGIVTAIIGLLLTAVVLLFIENKYLNVKINNIQKEWKDEVIEEVRKQIQPISRQVQESTNQVNETAHELNKIINK